MTDTRVDKVGARLPGDGEAKARAMIDVIEAAGLGVFDPDDPHLIRALALTLRREINSAIPVELAATVAAQLLRDIREACSRAAST